MAQTDVWLGLKWRNAVRGDLLFRIAMGALTLFFLVSPLGIQADDTPAVIASGQGAAVAISNWTDFTVQQPTEASTSQTAGLAGPGFPLALWPLQTTGTSLVMRGGPASRGELSATYVIQNGADPNPGFTIGFEADTQWDLQAGASLLLHSVKSYAVGKAKKTLKKNTSASSAGEDAVEDDPEDGVPEAIKAVKEVKSVYDIIKLIAKFFKALNPTFVMNIELSEAPGTTITNNSCVSKYQSTPGTANVQIFGPNELITPNNVDSFFVVSAGAANGLSPGLVDVGVNSLCDWVCSAWNGSLELLTTMDQSTCQAVLQETDPQYSDYNEIHAQNSCLPEVDSGVLGVPWVAPDFDSSVIAFTTETQCGTPQSIEYPVNVVDGSLVSICGTCPTPGSNEPLGDWDQHCDAVSYDPDQQILTANCDTLYSTDRTIPSTLQCLTGHWGVTYPDGENGQLECQNPPGSWADSCEFEYYGNGTLCASCGGVNTCATCPSGSWSSFDGTLMCETHVSQTQVLPPPDPGPLETSPLELRSQATLLAGRPISFGRLN